MGKNRTSPDQRAKQENIHELTNLLRSYTNETQYYNPKQKLKKENTLEF